jgi:hypothetical protein
MATHYAMARPARVERLAMLGPAGIVSSQYAKWLLGMIFKVRFRTTVAKSEWLLDTTVVERTRPQLRADPWRPIA